MLIASYNYNLYMSQNNVKIKKYSKRFYKVKYSFMNKSSKNNILSFLIFTDPVEATNIQQNDYNLSRWSYNLQNINKCTLRVQI